MKRFLGLCLSSLLCLIAASAGAVAPEGRIYATPEAAGEALVAALRGERAEQILEVLGGRAHELILSGDTTQDLAAWKRFVAEYEYQHALEKGPGERQTLVVGSQRYPFSIPLRKVATGWQFDVGAGVEESINRRVGRNELTTIEVLGQVVLAQDEYFTRDTGDRRAGQYAARFESSPGQKDGLYWPAAAGERPSPLGPLVAQAARQGYSGEDAAYFGYRYRMLPAQGKAARGGARQYTVGGRQIAGFAVLAWPVSYGTSGVKSFIVNQDGVIYERDLGSNTEKAAAAIKAFDPVKGWKPVDAK